MTLLTGAVAHERPWPHFVCRRAFTEAELDTFESLFASAGDWERHASVLYDGAMTNATDRVAPALLRSLAVRMSALVDIPLTSRVQLNLQRMESGQDVRVHSDVPLAGYECARLVVQLNRSWAAGDGGELRLHGSESATDVASVVVPAWGSAVGFTLTPTCFHSVATTRRQRLSLVFYFWHVANTPALARYLERLFGSMHVGALPEGTEETPRGLGAVPDEEATAYASMVAWALMQWGYDAKMIIRGYRFAIRSSVGSDCGEHRVAHARRDGTPVSVALRLAGWAATLRRSGFDHRRWAALAPLMVDMASELTRASERTHQFVRLAFPRP